LHRESLEISEATYQKSQRITLHLTATFQMESESAFTLYLHTFTVIAEVFMITWLMNIPLGYSVYLTISLPNAISPVCK